MKFDQSKIYHVSGEHDLIADDFKHAFVTRHLMHPSRIDLYAAMRAVGHDCLAAFVNAFGPTLFGHPDALAASAQAFESTTVYEQALEAAHEKVGEQFIKDELMKRCREIGGYAEDSKMALSIKLLSSSAAEPIEIDRQRTIAARDAKLFAEFMTKREEEKDIVERREARMRNASQKLDAA